MIAIVGDACAAANPDGLKPQDFITMVIGAPPHFPEGHSGAIRRVFWVDSEFLLTASDDTYAPVRLLLLRAPMA